MLNWTPFPRLPSFPRQHTFQYISSWPLWGMSSPTCPSDPQESWTLTIGTREYFIFLEDNFILQSACELSLKTPQRELKTGSERLLWFEGLDLLLQQPSIVFLSDRLWSVSMWCGGIQMHRKSQTDTVLKPAWSEVWTLRDKIPQHTHTLRHDPVLIPCMKRVCDSSLIVCVCFRNLAVCKFSGYLPPFLFYPNQHTLKLSLFFFPPLGPYLNHFHSVGDEMTRE